MVPRTSPCQAELRAHISSGASEATETVMTTVQRVSVEAQGLYKFFNPGHPTKAEYDGQTLRIFGDGVGSFANQQIDKVDLDLRWLHHALIVTLRNGTSIELSGFHGTGRQEAARSSIRRSEAPP